MLDPKEYATQLVEKYKSYSYFKGIGKDEFDEYKRIHPGKKVTLPEVMEFFNNTWAKDCALIDVQNTIDALKELVPPGTYSIYDDTWANVKDKIHFLNQVKEHIKQV